MKNISILCVIAIFLISGKDKVQNNSNITENQDQLLLSVLWFQRSAEMQALFYQCYNIAKSSLSEKLKKPLNSKPKAVIMDIDETVLNNSPVEAYQTIKNIPFSDSLWLTWVKRASAEPLPGVMDFIKYAESKGVEIFYITNRESPWETEPTLRNLREKGLPFADSIHLVLKTDMSSKEIRRKVICEKYDVLLLIGDNLADFDVVFDRRGDDLGFNSVKERMAEFGEKFIILPNPMYGPWINAAIKNSTGNTTKAKLLKSLISF
jgi:5'-nucleotidase (lipoprotein e(P4) family)